MIISKHMLSSAASEIRAAEASLNAIVAELDEADVWSGADADRFQREWNERVRGRLLGAAVALDATSVITLI